MNKTVYLDNSATTPVEPEVVEKMLPYFSESYGNANSQHAFGRLSMQAVDDSRDTVARLINAKPNEVYFTSGGTEADNWAIRGTFFANKDKGSHIIISAIEHPAVTETAEQLKSYGAEVTVIPVSHDGIVSVSDVEKAITDKTVLICVMYANNEIGTVQPVKEIAELGKKYGVTTFSDCVQAMTNFKIDVNDLGVDMISFSAHKFGGPKGVGVLYVRTGVKLDKLISGGHQERAKRGGTTNVPLIVGLSKALEMNYERFDENTAYVKSLRDKFVDEVLKRIDGVKINGSTEKRLVCNANLSFSGVESETMLFDLDLKGVMASAGSACSSGSLVPSHVLTAIGLTEKEAKGSVRFSFSRHNTVEDVDYAVDVLAETVEKLRRKNYEK